MHLLAQLVGRSHSLAGLALNNLITHTPADDAWMVAIATHHLLDVVLVPLVEERVVVVFVLCLAPSVKSLVDDEQAQRVAGIKKSL